MNNFELTKQQGFIQEYFKQLPVNDTNEAAYNAVEKLHFAYFGVNKYANYESFRVCLSRYYKK